MPIWLSHRLNRASFACGVYVVVFEEKECRENLENSRQMAALFGGFLRVMPRHWSAVKKL